MGHYFSTVPAPCRGAPDRPTRSAPDTRNAAQRHHQLHLPGEAVLGEDVPEVPLDGGHASPRLRGDLAGGPAQRQRHRHAGRACARRSGRTRRRPRSGDPRRTLGSSGPRNRRSQHFPFPEPPHRLHTSENIRITSRKTHFASPPGFTSRRGRVWPEPGRRAALRERGRHRRPHSHNPEEHDAGGTRTARRRAHLSQPFRRQRSR